MSDLEPRPKGEVAPLVSPALMAKTALRLGVPVTLFLTGHLVFALLFVAAYVCGRIDSAN